MSLPAGVTGVTVSSDKPLCLPDGTPYEGSIFFDGPDLVTIAGQDVVLGGSAEAVLEDGEYSIILAPNDITGMSPTGWAYRRRHRPRPGCAPSAIMSRPPAAATPRRTPHVSRPRWRPHE